MEVETESLMISQGDLMSESNKKQNQNNSNSIFLKLNFLTELKLS